MLTALCPNCWLMTPIGPAAISTVTCQSCKHVFVWDAQREVAIKVPKASKTAD